MRPLFECWDEVASRLAGSRVIALFLDFDGTLAAIRPRPDMVRVDPVVRRTLAALASSPRFQVRVISARRLADVRTRLRIPRVRYLGLYGWERTAAQLHPSSAVRHVKRLLAEVLPEYPGTWIEDKLHTIAVHYRAAPESLRPLVAERVQRAVACWHSCLRVQPGKCVWEILPADVGTKGTAVRRELAALPSHAVPMYVGDDYSDESAFAVLRHGVSVRVGACRRSRARYRVDSAADVKFLLERLKAEFV